MSSDTIMSSDTLVDPSMNTAELFFWNSVRVLTDNVTDDNGDDVDDLHHSFGVHVLYEDLYKSIIFLTTVYAAGVVCSRVFKMPNLVGEIVAGICLGPPLLEFVPNAEAWVMLGEIGLVILVLEAGIDIDVATLGIIGTRGFLIAVVGSILPIGLGMLFAWAVGAGDTKAIISTGAAFGPTSLGIALNILRGGGILNTPVGQLIISAAVIDDMIALIVLSQLESLTTEITAASVVIPLISALGYLLVGGYVAIWLMPKFMDKYVLPRVKDEHKSRLEFTVMIGLLLALMPATFYSKASYLMGAFVSGLAFCTSHDLHILFVQQFKRILQWLMRIFFAASIGFQVPIKDFADATVIWQGLVFSLALFGKLAVGFMVPNFTQSTRFTNHHLRDCLITGFSMAAEGEFAFVIAVFGVDNGLIDKDIYASIVLAVLISTIIPPFLLRFTISYYNKKGEEAVKKVVQDEMARNHDLESIVEGPDHAERLEEGIRNKTAVFLCIQTQSAAAWGLMHRLMAQLGKLGLEVIDHRAWSPRGVTTTLINEIYVKDKIEIAKGDSKQKLAARIEEITGKLEETINQPETSKVKVQRWYPGVIEEYTEAMDDSDSGETKLNLEERLLEAATAELERKQALQTNATQSKTVEEILSEMGKSTPPAPADDLVGGTDNASAAVPGKKNRRRRQKMRSTPVVGGGLFGEGRKEKDEGPTPDELKSFRDNKGSSILQNFKQAGHPAEIIVEGEVYKIRIDDSTLKGLRTGYSGDMLGHRGKLSSTGMSIRPDENSVVNQLKGYVRNLSPMAQINEGQDGSEITDGKSSMSHPKEDAV